MHCINIFLRPPAERLKFKIYNQKTAIKYCPKEKFHIYFASIFFQYFAHRKFTFKFQIYFHILLQVEFGIHIGLKEQILLPFRNNSEWIKTSFSLKSFMLFTPQEHPNSSWYFVLGDALLQVFLFNFRLSCSRHFKADSNRTSWIVLSLLGMILFHVRALAQDIPATPTLLVLQSHIIVAANSNLDTSLFKFTYFLVCSNPCNLASFSFTPPITKDPVANFLLSYFGLAALGASANFPSKIHSHGDECNNKHTVLLL